MSRKYNAQYASYRRRYIKSLSLSLATTRYNNYLEWDDRNGNSGTFCADEGKSISTEVYEGKGYEISFYSPNNFGYRSFVVLNHFIDDSITYYADRVPYYIINFQRCFDPEPITNGPGISVDKVINYDFTINCSGSGYNYFITDSVTSEVNQIVVNNPTENFSIKGFEWIHSKHLIKTTSGSKCNRSGFTCTCPDFTQKERPGWRDENGTATREWTWSQAGPFNPCKHIMAAKRLLNIPQSYNGVT